VLGASSFAHAFPKKAPLAEMPGMDANLAQTDKKVLNSGKAECEFEGNTFKYNLPDGSERKIPKEKMLDQGETIHGVWCSEKRAFILTNKKWIIVEATQDKQTKGRASLNKPFCSNDIRGIMSEGFVSWVATDDRIFILTDKIREISLDGEITIHGENLTDAKMMATSGLLLFVAKGTLFVDEIGTDLSAEKQLPPSNNGGPFTEKNGKISIGNTGIELIGNPDGGFGGFTFY